VEESAVKQTSATITELLSTGVDILQFKPGTVQAWLKICLTAFLIVLFLAPAVAQVSTASISGTITDTTGAAVSGATIIATQVDTQLTRTVISEASGAYSFPLLPLGSYTIKVSAAGFAPFQQTGIVLTVGEEAGVPVALSVGNINQTVTVNSDATMLNTTSSQTATLISQHQVEGLPLDGRNPASLVFLAGGVSNPILNIPISNTGNPILQNSLVYPTEIAATVHGVRGGGVYFSLDGANNVDPYQVSGGPFPNPDATEEFSVVSGNYGSRYVSAPGGAVNIVTKSGTNQIHGNVFEFIRNGAVNARNFFAAQPDALKRNQFGATAGAPILRDRWFVFGAYQGTRLSDIFGGNVAFVPTAQQRTGNLSSISTPITNPATGRPFPNNQVGPLNSVTQGLLAYIPLPTASNGSISYSQPEQQQEDQYVVKSDFVWKNQRIFGRYLYDTFNWPGTGIPGGDILASFRGQQHQWYNATIGHTWTRGTFISDARFSFVRDHSVTEAGESTVTLTTLGANITPGQFPTIQSLSTSGLFAVNPGNYNTFPRTTYDGAEDITLIRGRHELSFGAEVQHVGVTLKTDNQQNPIPNFTGAITGNALADYLLGFPASYGQSDGIFVQAVGVLPGFYAEDKIRMNNSLTVTAGLRWDPYWPFHALGGRVQCYIPGQQSKVFVNAPQGLVYPGDPNCRSSATNSNNLANIEPRIGFAWKADKSGKLVVRGGYGIYTTQFPLASFLAFGLTQPFERTFSLVAPGSVSNPYATFPGGNPFANGFQLNGNARASNSPFTNPGSAYSLTQNFKLAYVQQWSLVVENGLTPNDFVSVGYFGTTGKRLSLVQDANQPVYIPGASTQTNSQSRRPNQLVSAVNQEVDSGSSNYNAVEVTYRHRARGGFTLGSNFNWSRCLDDGSSPANVLLTGGAKIPIPGNPAFRYGRCDFDQTITWRTNGVWSLPWFAHSSGLKRSVLGGWQVSGILTTDSGFPFSVTSPFNQSFTGNGLDYADRVSGQSYTLPSGRSEQAKVAQFFNTAAFQENAVGTFGNTGRNIISAPDYVDVDTALVKGTQLTERFKLDLRFEFFNVLNHTQFLPPVSGLGSTLGRLTGARDPRILQGSVKVFF
jgi:Carboxypeptidase regulatory-like domain